MKSLYKNYLKRIFDIVFSVVLLLLFSWIILLILFLYILSFQFPIFFVQNRIGKNERPFELLKFRTLSQTDSPLKNRRFWLGDILRFTSLDELPQLLHVLRGKMSLIGPRPLPIEYLPLFSIDQRRRHTVLPGITGLAQVNGRHGLLWEEKFKLDLHYVNTLSFALDLKIVIKTIILILSFKKDTSLAEQKFTGSNNA